MPPRRRCWQVGLQDLVQSFCEVRPHADVGDTEEGRRDRSVGSRGSQP